jgi:hypothetical protein
MLSWFDGFVIVVVALLGVVAVAVWAEKRR